MIKLYIYLNKNIKSSLSSNPNIANSSDFINAIKATVAPISGTTIHNINGNSDQRFY